MTSPYPTERMERNRTVLKTAARLCVRKEATLKRELEYLAERWSHYISRLSPQNREHDILDELFNQTLDLAMESIAAVTKAQRLFPQLSGMRILSPGNWRGDLNEQPRKMDIHMPIPAPTVH